MTRATEQWEYDGREALAPAVPDWEEHAAATPRRKQCSRRSRTGRNLRLSRQLLVVLLVAYFSAGLCLGRMILAPGRGALGATPAGGSDPMPDLPQDLDESEQNALKLEQIRNHPELYPQALQELAEKNPEALDYVYQYPELHDQTPKIDLKAEAAGDKIHLLLQWDPRWGYQSYGSGLIGYTGCGPTCLSMVALYLTGNASCDPATVARYAEQEGYYVSGSGTAWALMETGCQHFGLTSEDIAFEEHQMAAQLQAGKPLICVLGPGDFTDAGHFIVITGYTGEGFTICDPNSPQRSSQIWTFARLEGQVKNVWAFCRSEGE